eukprot:g3437.t1
MSASVGAGATVQDLEQNLIQVKRRLQLARERAAKDRDEQLSAKRASLESALRELDERVDSDHACRKRCEDDLLSKQQQMQAEVGALMQARDASWEIERDRALEDIASRNIQAEDLRAKQLVIEAAMKRRDDEIAEIRAIKDRWGKSQAERLRNLVHEGSLLARELDSGGHDNIKLAKDFFVSQGEEHAGEDEVGEGAAGDAKLSFPFRLSSELAVVRNNRFDERMRELRGEQKRMNVRRLQLQRDRGHLRRKKREHALLQAKGLETLVALEEMKDAAAREKLRAMLLLNQAAQERDATSGEEARNDRNQGNGEEEEDEDEDEEEDEEEEEEEAGSVEELLRRVRASLPGGEEQLERLRQELADGLERSARFGADALEGYRRREEPGAEQPQAVARLRVEIEGEQEHWCRKEDLLAQQAGRAVAAAAVLQVAAQLQTEVVEEAAGRVWAELQATHAVAGLAVDEMVLGAVAGADALAGGADSSAGSSITCTGAAPPNALAAAFDEMRRVRAQFDRAHEWCIPLLTQRTCVSAVRGVPCRGEWARAAELGTGRSGGAGWGGHETADEGEHEGEGEQLRPLRVPQHGKREHEREVCESRVAVGPPVLLSMPPHTTRCCCARASPNGAFLAVGTLGGTISVWLLAPPLTPAVVPERPRPIVIACVNLAAMPRPQRPRAPICHLAWSMDSSSILSADDAGAVRVWSLLPAHGAPPDATFHDDMSKVAPRALRLLSACGSPEFGRPRDGGDGGDGWGDAGSRQASKADAAAEARGCEATCAVFHPAVTFFGDQPHIVVGTRSGWLVKRNGAAGPANAKLVYGELALATAPPRGATAAAAAAKAARREFFKAHRDSIVHMGFVPALAASIGAKTGPVLLTVDAMGVLRLWPYERQSLSGYGWFVPLHSWQLQLGDGCSLESLRVEASPCSNRLLVMLIEAAPRGDDARVGRRVRFATLDLSRMVFASGAGGACVPVPSGAAAPRQFCTATLPGQAPAVMVAFVMGTAAYVYSLAFGDQLAHVALPPALAREDKSAMICTLTRTHLAITHPKCPATCFCEINQAV